MDKVSVSPFAMGHPQPGRQDVASPSMPQSTKSCIFFRMIAYFGSGKLNQSMRILLAPLNWGLGHATRCIPIAEYLLDRGHQLWIASSGEALAVLRRRFPDQTFVELPDYRIRYPFRQAVLNFLLGQPYILRAIFREHRQVKRLVKSARIEVLISDNRFGCRAPGIPCIFLTHQLRFRLGNRVLNFLAAWANYFWYRHFTGIWVPDLPPPQNLSGTLSRPLTGPRVRYIGPLSQLKKQSASLRYRAIAILSGPEPQRSYLEAILYEQLTALPGPFLLVRGLPTPSRRMARTDNLEVMDFLGPEALSTKIAESGLVICRSGYSSIMDLKHLGKKAILIPTPGQPEQEYLGERLRKDLQFLVGTQDELNLSAVLAHLENRPVKVDAAATSSRRVDYLDQAMRSLGLAD